MTCWIRSDIADEQSKAFVSLNEIEHNLCPLDIWYISKPVNFFEVAVFELQVFIELRIFVQSIVCKSEDMVVKTCGKFCKSLVLSQPAC
jgi:hypothetical protein